MAMTDNAAETQRPLNPSEIGALVRAARMLQGWTQETLAELSGLQTRTIQRVEQGQPSSPHTHRALARGFGLSDLDYFVSLRSFPTEEALREQKAAFNRDFLLIDGCRVTGRQLLALMQQGPGFGCLARLGILELPREVENAFAAISDFASDCQDILHEVSQTDILGYGDALDEIIQDLKAASFDLFAARRQVSVTNDSWTDKRPMVWHITYIMAVPKDHAATKVAVPRKVSFNL